MNINYKITTIVLAVILAVVLAWCCCFMGGNMGMKNKEGVKQNSANMHMMPDGSMMANDGSSMMDMTMNDMVKDLQGKTGRELEKAFILGMIPHHQGAVDMAKLLLQDKTIGAKFVKFGNDIITAQEGEIRMMQDWLKNY